MKKIILTSLISCLVVGCALTFTSFKNGPEDNDYILVRVMEANSHIAPNESRIYVIQGTSVINTVELELAGKKNSENTIKIASVLSEIKNKGYRLVSSNGTGFQLQTITTYVFEK